MIKSARCSKLTENPARRPDVRHAPLAALVLTVAIKAREEKVLFGCLKKKKALCVSAS